MICTSSDKQITSVATSNYCNYIFPHQFAYLFIIALLLLEIHTSRDSVNLSQKYWSETENYQQAID